MLQIDDTALLIIDIQGKLASLMYEKERLYDNTVKMLQAARILGLDVICTEQYPQGLGPTVPEISEHLDVETIPKLAFSCCGQEEFGAALARTGCSQVLVAGIETHICVFQTTMDLLAGDYDVHILSDAVSSRTKANWKLGLERMNHAGAVISGVEMALFEMLQVAKGDQFKQIAKIVK